MKRAGGETGAREERSSGDLQPSDEGSSEEARVVDALDSLLLAKQPPGCGRIVAKQGLEVCWLTAHRQRFFLAVTNMGELIGWEATNTAEPGWGSGCKIHDLNIYD